MGAAVHAANAQPLGWVCNPPSRAARCRPHARIPPPPGHSLVAVDDGMLVFGGQESSGTSSDCSSMYRITLGEGERAPDAQLVRLPRTPCLAALRPAP